MELITMRHFLLMVSLFVASTAAMAQKPTPKQIADAEKAFRDASCSLRYEKIADPANPQAPPKVGPVDMIALHESITDADLARLIPLAVKGLPNLKALDLHMNMNLTAKGYAHLAKLKTLLALYLDGSKLDDECLEEVVKIPGVRILDLSGTLVTSNGLKKIAKMESLTHLMLERLPGLTAEGVESLSQCATLRILELELHRNVFTAISKALPSLTLINELSVSNAIDSDAVEIAKMRNLQVLRIGYNWDSQRLDDRKMTFNSIGDVGLRAISQLQGLRVLDASGNRFTKVGMENIAKLQNLEELNLSFTSINDASMQQVVKLKHLVALNISNTYITHNGIVDLAKLPALNRLQIAGNDIGDEALHQIARLKVLKYLDASYTRVTCKSYHDVSGLVNLDHLLLVSTNINEQSLRPLSTLKNLKLLDLMLNCPNIQPPMVEAIRPEMPKTQILYSRCEACWCGGIGYAFRMVAPRTTSARSTTVATPGNSISTPPPKMAPAIRAGGPATGTNVKPN